MQRNLPIFQDLSVRILFAGILGLAALEGALILRASRQLTVPRPAATPRVPRPTPTPAPRLRPLRAEELSPLGAVEERAGTLILWLPTGGKLEQRREGFSLEQTPRASAEEEDARLVRWGPEYQRLALESRGTYAWLDYALNLPGEATTRTRTYFGISRRRPFSLTITAPEEQFEATLAALEPLALPLNRDRP